jgi:hypothetical protein
VGTDWLERKGEIKDLTGSSRLLMALFGRPDTAPVLSTPVEAGDGFAAAVLAGRQAPSAETLKAKREEYAAKLLTAKRNSILEEFLAGLREKAEIKVLAKL